jgi:transcription initiation factor TFIIF subunit alpha
MPPKSAESLLFHKKKPIKKDPSVSLPNGTPTSPRKSATPRQQPTPPNTDDVEDSTKLPDGEFSEYKLMSSALNGWKYDVMKFDSRKPVDVSTWEEPIKLNRKDLRRQESTSVQQVPVRPMLGLDGKPVIGSDGRIVMVDADGRPIANTSGESSSKEKETKGKTPTNGKKKMTRKTRQVFKVPEDVRQLRKEERFPWVMEDARQNEVWVGQLEEVSKAETHALFMPAAQEVFKFVPANRWYKYHKKPKHHVPDLEEAESLVCTACSSFVTSV